MVVQWFSDANCYGQRLHYTILIIYNNKTDAYRNPGILNIPHYNMKKVFSFLSIIIITVVRGKFRKYYSTDNTGSLVLL